MRSYHQLMETVKPVRNFVGEVSFPKRLVKADRGSASTVSPYKGS